MAQQLPFLIAGGGIGGLAAALVLVLGLIATYSGVRSVLNGSDPARALPVLALGMVILK